MAGKFDLGKLIAEGKVSKLDTGADGREQIEYIDIDLIDDEPNNFYKLSGIDALAENIELVGLQQPLRVRTNSEDPTRVIIVSGHRRRAAIKKLVKDGRTDFREIPCIRDVSDTSAALQELRLIYANNDTREMTPAEKSKQAERAEMLLYKLKEEGYDFPGRMRDHVAAACKISAPKLARLKVIRERLIPGFMVQFEADKLPEQTAYTLARFPEEFQFRISKVMAGKDLRGYVVEEVLKEYEGGCRWEPTMDCRDGKPCKHGDAALRHDLENSYGHCRGKKCCLTCDEATRNWSPCERMCSKAKAQRKDAKEQADAKDEKERKKTQKKYQNATQKNALRLLKAIDASGLGDEETIRWEYCGIKIGEIRQYAAGDFSNAGHWYGPQFEVENLRYAVELAKKLGCSTDYLFGLTDELNPASVPPAEGWVPLQWIPGMEPPPKVGQQAVAKFKVEGMEKPLWTLVEWTGSQWCFRGNGATIEAECVGWFPLPEDQRDD